MDDENFSSPKLTLTHEIGQSLDALSVNELSDRIALLQAEILRLERARATKTQAVNMAATFFKTSPT